jgi:hypothetical protein
MPFLAEPKTLTVVGQHHDRSRSPIAERERGSSKWIIRQRFADDSYKAIDAVTKVDRIDADRQTQVGSQLKDQRDSQTAYAET